MSVPSALVVAAMGWTHEQIALRQSGIGGSDIGAICGLSSYRRPIDVWLEKTGHRAPSPTSMAAEWGHRLEPLVADVYAEIHGVHLCGPFGPMRADIAPWFVMTPDRLVVNDARYSCGDWEGLPPREHTISLLEIKTTSHARGWGAPGSDQIPLAYLAQVAWYLAGLDIDMATVAVLIATNDYREYQIHRDHKFETALITRASEFWRFVKSETPPDPDGSKAYREYLASRFGSTVERIAPRTVATDELAASLRGMRKRKRELDRSIAKAEQQIQVAIGDNEAIDSVHGALTFRFDKRGRTNWQAMARALASDNGADMDALIESYRGAPARRFLTPRSWLTDNGENEE